MPKIILDSFNPLHVLGIAVDGGIGYGLWKAGEAIYRALDEADKTSTERSAEKG